MYRIQIIQNMTQKVSAIEDFNNIFISLCQFIKALTHAFNVVSVESAAPCPMHIAQSSAFVRHLWRLLWRREITKNDGWGDAV